VNGNEIEFAPMAPGGAASKSPREISTPFQGGNLVSRYDESGVRRSLEIVDQNKKTILKAEYDKDGLLDKSTAYNADGTRSEISKDELGYRTEVFDKNNVRRNLKFADNKGNLQLDATFDANGKFEKGNNYLPSGIITPIQSHADKSEAAPKDTSSSNTGDSEIATHELNSKAAKDTAEKSPPQGNFPREDYVPYEDGTSSLSRYDANGVRRYTEIFDRDHKTVHKTEYDKDGLLDKATAYLEDGTRSELSKDESGYRTERFDNNGVRRGLQLTDDEGNLQLDATFDANGAFVKGNNYFPGGIVIPIIQKTKGMR
jgi:hypothetical protein